MSKAQSILQTLSLAALLRMVRLALSLGITCLLARHLGSAGFGEIGVALAFVSILICVGELGFGRYTVRELIRNPQEQADVLGNTVVARLIVSMVLFAGLMLWIILAQPAGGMLICIYSLQLLTHPSTEVFAWLEAHERVQKTVVAQFIGFIISATCIAIGIWNHAPLWFFALTYALEGWVFIVLSARVFWKHGGQINLRAFKFSRALALVSRSWPELVSQVALILLFRLDIMMIEWLRNTEEAGIYSVAVRLSEMAYFIPGVLAMLFLPRLINAHQDDANLYKRLVIDYLSTSVILSFAVAAGLIIISPWISLAFGSEFARSTEMLRVHAWAFIPYAIGIARTQILTVEDRLAANLSSVILAVGINAALNLIWIPSYGGVGAAWATLVSYTAAWVVCTYLAPGLRTHVSALMTSAIVGLPRFTLVRVRALLHSS